MTTRIPPARKVLADKIKNEIKVLPPPSSERFGARVFHKGVMKKLLPPEVYQNVVNAMEKGEKINPDFADTIAIAMKDWAVGLGASHFSHIFQPMTGATAEKHDAFLEWNAAQGGMIEKFSGKQLIQGEPDASSFPSGGLRTTYEARGYTGWDPTSPVFVWKAGDGITLCIPSVFFSWTGAVLDNKIPLLRSEKKLCEQALRLTRLTGIEANFVYSTVGPEQEYFVIDRSLYRQRPDLVLAGRTVFGAPSPKGQELQDHYFASVKDVILNYMREFEIEALELGIPVKTRHNEVAPGQYEVAPVFERSTLAVDHNLLLMELMRQIARKHDLTCLLHEKPFKDINGSGKHTNWSLCTDTGINLLDPTDTPEDSLHFLILVVAILHAIRRHGELLRASIGSAANDFRLGGHEAPPAIISVYLGETLQALFENIATTGTYTSAKGKKKYQLELPASLDLPADNTDRNRTSPFAFTGNKFEFRAVGSSSNPAFPVTVINAIVAESLKDILDEIEENSKRMDLPQAVRTLLAKTYNESKEVLFNGDNYSKAWKQEAKKRKLPDVEKSMDAFGSLIYPETLAAFKGILTQGELESRLEIYCDIYASKLNIEANLMIDLFRTRILPAAIEMQQTLSLTSRPGKGQKEWLKEISDAIELGLSILKKLEKAREKALVETSARKKASAFGKVVLAVMEELREVADFLETHVDDSLWTLPKYQELLFLI